MLPLGRRVQDKLEALIDKHMYQLGESNPLPANGEANDGKALPNWPCRLSHRKKYGRRVGV
jgi:hypothetical protein